MRTCIYCRSVKQDDQFNREHVVPRGFGMFEPNLTLGDVCEECNSTMGREIETPGIRGSIEGVHRYQTPELRNVEAFAKTPSDRVAFEREEPEWEGVRVFLRLTEDGKDFEEVLPPQVRINLKNGRRLHYLLDELPGALDRTTIDAYRIFSQSKDDLAAVADALAKRGLTPRWQDPVEQLPNEARTGKVTARVLYDDISRRLVAKICFNYLAGVTDAAFNLKTEFDVIRRFIRYGEGRGSDLVRPLSWPVLREEQEVGSFRATDDHIVAIDEERSRGLVGHVSLFNMIHNEILLSRVNPEVVIWRLPSGHRFDWRDRKIDPLLHVPRDNLVLPPSVAAEQWRRRRQ